MLALVSHSDNGGSDVHLPQEAFKETCIPEEKLFCYKGHYDTF